MPVMSIWEARARSDDALGEFKELIMKHLPETRAFEGCRSIDAYVDKQSRTVVLVEFWDARVNHADYMSWRAQTGVQAHFASEVARLLEPDFSSQYFDPLDVQRLGAISH